MELGPIFRALLHNRTRFWLITLEVALTMAIVINCVTLIQDLRRQLNEPNGLDEENLLAVSLQPFGEDHRDGAFAETVRDQDMRRLRGLPGVREATVISFIPLAGSGSVRDYRPVGFPARQAPTPYFRVGPRALPALGVEVVAGRDFLPSDFSGAKSSSPHTSVIVTQALADQLFPDGDALGKRIEDTEETQELTIIGIVRRMHNAWPTSPIRNHAMLQPGYREDWSYVQYLVRAEPGAAPTLLTELEDVLRSVDRDRIIKVRTILQLKARSFRGPRVLAVLLGAIIVMLTIVTLLGIIGLTSFSVTERTRQIGTRRALGATKAAILRHFLVENFIVTGVGLGLGVLLALGLNYALAQITPIPRLTVSTLALGASGLWLAGLLATLAPALRATTVTPELATRSV